MITKSEITEKLYISNRFFGSVVVIILLHSFLIYAKPILDTTDTKGPVITKASHCGDYLFNINDDQSYLYNQDTFHIDAGMTEPPVLLYGLSNNISDISSSSFETDKINFDYSFSLQVLNKFEEAKAVFFVVDQSKKFSFDSIIYKPEKLFLEPDILSFGNVFVDSQSELSTQIKNISQSEIVITNVRLKNGLNYQLKNIFKEYLLDTNELLEIAVLYNPDVDFNQSNELDYDTLIIETSCLRYTIPINGKGVIAQIIVDDIDFGAIEVNSKVDYNNSFDPIYGKGLRISNYGSGSLILDGYYDLAQGSPFSVSTPTFPDINKLEIESNSEQYINNISFEPTSIGEFKAELIFKNNARGPDSICKIRGIAYNPGPYFNSLNFGRVRIGDTKKGYIYLRNSGTNPIDISGFVLSENNPEFRILFNETVPQVSTQNPVKLYPDLPQYKGKVTEIAVAIEFFPIFEYQREIKIMPIVVGANNDESVFNYIRGFGFKPSIRTQGYIFIGQTLVNIMHPDIGVVKIFSESWSSDLFIKRIDALSVGFTSSSEFIFGQTFPTDTLIRINDPYIIPVRFNPTEAGDRQILLRVISDAYIGPENSKWDTSYISITGKSYNKVLAVENISLDGVFHCSTKNLRIKVKNISDTTNANISEVVVVKGDSSAFVVENIKETIAPRDSAYINVFFDSGKSEKDTFEIFVRVLSDVDSSTGVIRICTFKNKAIVSLPIIENTLPGVILDSELSKKRVPDFDIMADFTDIKVSDIYSFSVEIKYNKSYLLYTDKVKSGNLTNLWNEITAHETDIDDTYALLTIQGSGSVNLSGLFGILCKPVFMVLLGDTNSIDVELVNATFGQADHCIDNILNNGLLRMSYCGDEVRKIVIANRFYDLKSKSGNPVYGDIAEICYNIAIDAITKIELINSLGESIKVINNGYLTKGTYNYYLDVKNLTSGMYMIKIQSGPYIETLKIMLMK